MGLVATTTARAPAMVSIQSSHTLKPLISARPTPMAKRMPTNQSRIGPAPASQHMSHTLRRVTMRARVHAPRRRVVVGAHRIGQRQVVDDASDAPQPERKQNADRSDADAQPQKSLQHVFLNFGEFGHVAPPRMRCVADTLTSTYARCQLHAGRLGAATKVKGVRERGQKRTRFAAHECTSLRDHPMGRAEAGRHKARRFRGARRKRATSAAGRSSW